MWAMIPMLRTLPRSVSTSRATRFLFPRIVAAGPAADVREAAGPAPGGSHRARTPTACPLPAVVGEGLVGLRHLVRVLAPLHGGTQAVRGVEQLVGQPLDHRLLAAGPGVRDQ